ncbi:MAG: GlsB/YeaQ/YmgE family stress response membrane protein [Bacteroidota bacterium]
MDLTSLLIFLAVGAIAGWLAGQLMKGGGYGLLWNIILGIIGGIVGGWLFGQLGISSGGGLLGSLITSVVGAVAVLFVVNLFKK